jgi:hypothetical protein
MSVVGLLAATAGCSTSKANDVPLDAGAEERPADAAPSADALPSDADGASVVTVPLTGCTAGTYLVPLTVGAQRFSAVLDTGSTTLALAGKECSSCGVSPEYTPGSTAADEHEAATSVYGGDIDAGGSGWTGEIYRDTVGITALPTTTAPVRLVSIQDENQFFYPFTCGSSAEPFQGIVGFAPGADAIPGTTGYFDDLVAAAKLPDVFATQLCDPDGYLWLGGYDPAHVTAPPQYTPYSGSANETTSYVVDMEQVSIDGASYAVPMGQYSDTILDTGNSAFFLPPPVFDPVVNAIVESAGFRDAFGADAGGGDAGEGAFFSMTSNCATTTKTAAELDATLPPITLVFRGTPTVSITAKATESYLVPVGGGGWCPGLLTLAPDEDYPFVASLGAPILRSSVVIFDRAHSRIGFAPHGPCP